MSITCVLIRGDQRGRSQYPLRIAPHLRNLLAMADKKRFDLTAPSTKQNIITIVFGERSRTFYLEGNLLVSEITPKRKLDGRACYNAPQTIIRRASAALVNIRQGMERVGNSTFSEVVGIREANEVRGANHPCLKISRSFL